MSNDRFTTDHFAIPADFVELASNWYDGSGSMLYAIASTGELTRGSIRPTISEDEKSDGTDGYHSEGEWITVHRQASDAEWYLGLWADLGSELRYILKTVPQTHPDYHDIHRFAVFVDGIEEQLRKQYGLE
jgi:hypothetical protein